MQVGCESVLPYKHKEILIHKPNSASLRRRNFLGRLLQLVLLGTLTANVLVTVLLTKASMMNYPGGEALTFFNIRYADQDDGNIHKPPKHPAIFSLSPP